MSSSSTDNDPLDQLPSAEVPATADTATDITPPEDTIAGSYPSQPGSPIFSGPPPLRGWHPLRRLRRSLTRRTLRGALLVLLLLAVITPLLIAANYAIRGYQTYTTLRTHATNGFQHLLAVKTLFTVSGPNHSNILNPANLTLAQKDFAAAHNDFVAVQTLLDQSDFVQTISQLPQYRRQLTSAHAASQIGIDIADIGQLAIGTATTFLPRLHGPLLGNAQTPLLTSSDLTLFYTTIDAVLPLLDDIQNQWSMLSLDALPLSPRQRDQAQQVVRLLPQLRTALTWGENYLGAVDWLLGVDSPRTFLVQTMDRAELRPTGGFTGQYGELQINGGRIAPFSLHDISFVEYASNSPTTGNLAPGAYRSWWPFANWGLRDSNLSADFPTSAQLAIDQYKLEVKHQVDGVIVFTPFLIERVLQATGPLYIPKYDETITAQNLEQRLHYYQLDNAGIRKEEIVEHVEDPFQARKLFTSMLAHSLIDHVRGASTQELIALGRELLQALKTKDLQVYVSNEQIEDLLKQHGDAAEVDRSTTHDGLYIVQANVSASKASQYVKTIVQDTVNLDATGGATHVLQLRLVYNQLGPVYGLDTYRDYVRVYVPPTARFRWGDGFDSGTPLCGGPFAPCSADGIYPHGELICPTGQYNAGAAAPMLNDPYTGQWHPLDKIGPPTNFQSDEPGRAMFGGYVVIPKNCTMTVTLSWYVPPQGHNPYALLIQRQAATFPELDLTVLPNSSNCSTTSALHFNGTLTEDTSFQLKTSQPHATSSVSSGCIPQPVV
ncbi:MAG: DUF4012 domain-containing protein [Chloroflexi bacterium]|nr:DUF4012 domain-containing protein [Chloroflexota bacterium]